MSNPVSQFLQYIGGAPLQVATITAIEADNTLSVVLPSGGALRVRGTGAVGSNVFIRGDLVEGPAPSLPLVTAEV